MNGKSTRRLCNSLRDRPTSLKPNCNEEEDLAHNIFPVPIRNQRPTVNTPISNKRPAVAAKQPSTRNQREMTLAELFLAEYDDNPSAAKPDIERSSRTTSSRVIKMPGSKGSTSDKRGSKDFSYSGSKESTSDKMGSKGSSSGKKRRSNESYSGSKESYGMTESRSNNELSKASSASKPSSFDKGKSQQRRYSGITIENTAENTVENTTAPLSNIEVCLSENESPGGIIPHDSSDERKQGKNKLSELSPIMICGICTCYITSLILMMCIGLGLGYLLLPSLVKDDDVATSSTYDSTDGGSSSIDWKENGDGSLITEDLSASTLPQTSERPSSSPSFQLSSDIPSNSNIPTDQSSWQPSASSPPSSLPTNPPTVQPSFMPSSTPTMGQECPDELTKYITLDEDGLFTLKYHVVIFPDGSEVIGLGGLSYDPGGILCVSLEYTGSESVGWLGLAFSEAARDPEFGYKEAIIGIPGIQSTMAVGTDKDNIGLGQQIGGAINGFQFGNPARYDIPAGSEFSGPILANLADMDKQTLMNGLVSIESGTSLEFQKYLNEPGQVAINPYESTILLYAVSTLNDNDEYDNSFEWQFVDVIFENDNSTAIDDVARKRARHHRDRDP